MHNLAIVIPAYKPNFFGKALQSLAEQTNKDFTVYIGDDNSPFNLKEVVDDFENIIQINYTKFDNNIGAENLVLQWNRCVRLTQDENWIWLFSDDDIADKDAVKNFYSVLERNSDEFDVYRFNTVTIASDDSLLNINPVGPDEESSEEMAYNLLLGQRGNSMPDHIFSRSIFDKCGGFVFTKYAQGADWATSILFSKEKGMCIIPNSKLYWRYSGINVSSVAYKNTSIMLIGHLQFIEWILAHFKYLRNNNFSISYQMIVEAASFNLVAVMVNHYKKLSIKSAVRIYWLYRYSFHYSVFKSIKNVILIKEKISPDFLLLMQKYNKYKNIIKKINL